MNPGVGLIAQRPAVMPLRGSGADGTQAGGVCAGGDPRGRDNLAPNVEMSRWSLDVRKKGAGVYSRGAENSAPNLSVKATNVDECAAITTASPQSKHMAKPHERRSTTNAITESWLDSARIGRMRYRVRISA